MSKFFKRFSLIIVFILLITSTVFAEDIAPTTPESNTPISSTTENQIADRDKDLSIRNSDNYSINESLNGNAFIKTNKLSISPLINNASPLIINGDVFAIVSNANIESNVVFSDSKDKSGNYMIDKINLSTEIKGNVYVMATDTFTLDSGSKIDGDLYVYATTVNINNQATVKGNLFVFGNSTLNLHGTVNGSVYGVTSTYNMNFTGHVEKDLALTITDTANISGQIDRNTKIYSEKGRIVTSSDFITKRDLFVDVNDFQFAGEVQGDAKISAKALEFNDSKTCVIQGDLDYASKSEMTIPTGIVKGETKVSAYTDRTSFSYIILKKVVSYVSLILYVFIVALIFKYIAPTFVEKISKITTTNIFVGLGVGFGLILAFFPVLLLLLLTNFTIALAFILLLAVLFIGAIATPLFVLAIANAWKSEKINLYFKMLIITSILFLVSLIPNIGITITLLFIIIAIGKILTGLFYKRS